MLANHQRREKLLSHKETSLRWRKYIAQVCLNALRHNKQEEQLQRVTNELFDVEIPRREQCELDTLED